MTLTLAVVVAVAAFVSAFTLTRLVRGYAISRSILDLPNERSLHRHPTPRGGGLGMAATFVAGVVLLGVARPGSFDLVAALAGGGSLVVLIGWLDDRYGLRPLIRLAAHTTAAVWALAWLGGVDRLQLGNYVLQIGIAGNIAAVIGAVWWINLYNFMDGIDGIAGGQALAVSGGAALLMAAGHTDGFVVLPLLLAGAAAGFLVLNWAPASVFMGDAGSGFLGFAFAILAVASEQAGALPILYWVLLSGVFIFDSTVTLMRRVVRAERWYAPHRSHAYQRLVALGYSHARVAGGVLLINALICAMLALVVRGILHVGVVAGIELVGLAVGYLLVEMASPMQPSSPTASPARTDLA